MNRTAPAHHLEVPVNVATDPAALFARFADRDDFAGFGYIGARRNQLDGSDAECPARPDLVAAVDAWIVARAQLAGWTEEQLFDWANSRDGRFFADVVFGSGSTDLAADLAEAVRFGLFTAPTIQF